MITDNDIMQALECCSKKPTDCRHCSYLGKCNEIKPDAFKLITRLQAELQVTNETLDNSMKLNARVREDTTTEFAERLREKLYHHTDGTSFDRLHMIASDLCIENVATEMKRRGK